MRPGPVTGPRFGLRDGTPGSASLHNGSAIAPVGLAPHADPDTGLVAPCDWIDLLGAVEVRLRGGAAAAPAAAESPLRGCVLECVEALAQLRLTLGDELSRSARLERELGAAREALAQARVELVGTRAGERQARHRALHDDLTALPNRSYFREWLDHALQRGAPDGPALAVLYVDLDGFKAINDRHGHEIGDALLRTVAARLGRAVRSGDLVSRLGGDEFACLLADPLGRDQLSALAAKLFDAVSAPFRIGALTLMVQPSIGIAVCPEDGDTTDALLASADAAMYRAKAEQSGFGFFAAGDA